MKSLTKHDLILIGIFLFIGIALGWLGCFAWNSRKVPITIENPVNTALIKKSDSLEAVVKQRDLVIDANDKFQFAHDSTLIMNNKTLAKEYDKIKVLDDSSRSAYVELALKRANIRHR